MRATSRVGTPQTSAARRAAISFCTDSWVGSSTLPPMWPHFFADESWSSKCTPAAPASIMSFISSNAFSTPPKPASASATMGEKPVDRVVPFGVVNLVGPCQSTVDAANQVRRAAGRVQALVRVHLTGVVGVRRDLPPRQVDRLQTRLGHLNRLISRHRAERTHAGQGVESFPEPIRPAPSEGVLDGYRSAQAHHVGAGVPARYAIPARILSPPPLEGRCLLLSPHRFSLHTSSLLRPPWRCGTETPC